MPLNYRCAHVHCKVATCKPKKTKRIHERGDASGSQMFPDQALRAVPVEALGGVADARQVHARLRVQRKRKREILNKRKFPSFVVLAPLEVSSQLCDLGAHIPLWPQRHRGSDERWGRKCPSISRQSSLTVNTTNCCDGDNKTLLKHALCETRRRAKPTSYFQN